MKKEIPVKVYQLANHQNEKSTEPVYQIVDGKFYRTVYHTNGWSELPDYELRTDGFIYRTVHHPSGIGKFPDYCLRKDVVLEYFGDLSTGSALRPAYKIKD